MAYTKQNFENGKILTAEQLNRMDAGILEASQTAEALMQAKESGELNGEDGKTAYEYAKDGGYAGSEEAFAEKLAKELPTKLSQLTNDAGYLTGYTESDPTVPAWAKAASKPAYTAQEVGALPDTYTPPDQTAEQVGADPNGTAVRVVSEHNTDEDSHNDIRLELEAISNRMNAFFDSDDQTLDELSEIVACITSNKTLIEAVTTSKVSVADIVNNLTTNVGNKPLSAAQGVALKALIDAIVIPTKLSQLANDKGYLTGYTETDPTVPAWAKAASKPTYTAAEVGALTRTDMEPFTVTISGNEQDGYQSNCTPEEMGYAVMDGREVLIYFNDILYYLTCLSEHAAVVVGYDGQELMCGTIFANKSTSLKVLAPLSEQELPEAVNTALAQAKASGEFDGADGKDGYTPVKGVDYFDGNGIKSAVLNADYTLTLTFTDGTKYTTPSIRGATGAPGKDGAAGYTPVKGVDYWTAADKAEMVSSVIAALPVYNGEVV